MQRQDEREEERRRAAEEKERADKEERRRADAQRLRDELMLMKVRLVTALGPRVLSAEKADPLSIL